MWDASPVADEHLEGSPNGMAPLSKSGGRKPLGVRLLYPPQKYAG